MATVESEEVLRALAELDEGPVRPAAIDTEALAAYRRGELIGEERASVESALAGDPEARAALAAGAGVPMGPSPSVRATVLADLAAPRRHVRSWWGLAAAAALVGVLFAAHILVRPERPLPNIETAIERTSEVRGSRPVTSWEEDRVRVAADEPFRIAFRPALDAEPHIEIGLYRRQGDAVVRVDEEPWVTDDSQSGSGFLLIDSARALVGEQPGTTTVWLVVAWRGDLPKKLTLAPGADDDQVAARLADGGRRRPVPHFVDIVAEAP